MLPKWLIPLKSDDPCPCGNSSDNMSLKSQYLKETINGISYSDAHRSFSLIEQYVIGSRTFGTQMMWVLENITGDAKFSAVVTDLIPYIERGDLWRDESGTPVVVQIHDVTEKAKTRFRAEFNRDQLDPIVRSLLVQPTRNSLVTKLERYTLGPEIKPEHPELSLRDLCAFLERVIRSGHLECAQLYLPVSGWDTSCMLEIPPVLGMVRTLYDFVSVYVDADTSEIRWILACNKDYRFGATLSKV